jgi:hypothetical protein
MRLEYVLESAAYRQQARAAYKNVTKKSKLFSALWLISFLSGCVAGVLLYRYIRSAEEFDISGFTNPDANYLAAALVFAFACLIARYFVYLSLLQKNYIGAKSPYVGPHIMQLRAEGISLKSTHISYEMDTAAIYGFLENDDYFFILIDKLIGTPVPKTALPSETQKAEFREILDALTSTGPEDQAQVRGDGLSARPVLEADIVHDKSLTQPWGAPSPSFVSSLAAELRACARNLYAGFRLALLRNVRPADFKIGGGQAICFGLIFLAIFAGIGFIIIGGGGEFNVDGLPGIAIYFMVFAAGIYAIAKLQRAPESGLTLAVMLMSAAPTFIWIFIFLLIVWAFAVFSFGVDTASGDERYIEFFRYAFVALAVIWGTLVTTRAIQRTFGTSTIRSTLLGAVFLTFIWSVAWLAPAPTLWQHSSELAAARSTNRRVNVENTYYKQPALMAATIEQLAAGRAGIPELYFIGFGGTSSENVFLRETIAVQELFDERFDTRDRSLVLINNAETVDRIPLANKHNLMSALNGVAERMNLEEDILFLFLTSHGARGRWLSTRFGSLRLNRLRAEDLTWLLDLSGIKWRVVVISACYSGGFIDEIANEYTLVITASRSDRNSFGCSDDEDFTYFGRAFFDEQLREEISFIDAFERALPVIAAREKAKGFKLSEPQMRVGAAIRPRLAALEQRLRALADAGAAN